MLGIEWLAPDDLLVEIARDSAAASQAMLLVNERADTTRFPHLASIVDLARKSVSASYPDKSQMLVDDALVRSCEQYRLNCQ